METSASRTSGNGGSGIDARADYAIAASNLRASEWQVPISRASPAGWFFVRTDARNCNALREVQILLPRPIISLISCVNQKSF
jgi:hypothetical protein